jgi:peptide/nickel transport system permease protein
MAAQSTIANLKTEKSEEVKVSPSLLQLAVARLRRDKLSMAAIIILVTMAVLAYGAPIITRLLGVDPYSIKADSFLPPFSPGHLLGTDDLGRDHLARLLYAGQVSLAIGFMAAVLSLFIGVSIGLLTGFFGGVVDDIVIWLITTINSVPFFFIVLIIAAVLSPGPETLILVLGFLGWTGTTRLVRGETLSLREREFVISARAIGATPVRIMFNHILPNLISIILINLAIDIGVIILVEAGLSYLGVGVKPPTATWGNMLTGTQSFFTRGPHLVFWPGLLIFLTVLCLYVLGDGLRDAFDPTTVD